jgi:aspartyl-tRNA(Asn)/glutamyl-tRNA(Gln) amidotransferase subunit A
MPSVRDRLEQCLARIADPQGEGARAFIHVSAERARAEADAADARRRHGTTLGPLDGTIVSIKDLFDTAGERTTVGSALFRESAPKTADCPAVARLRAAGAVLIGKTNLSEFAFHAMGTNPHFGTPGNAKDRKRVPGGSSSGAAISVADGMADIGLGSDTAGSIRTPSALNGLVGFKPTQKRVPLDGAFPLSFTLDSAGPLAKSVADAHVCDAVLAAEPYRPIDAMSVRGLRLALPGRSYLMTDLDGTVGPAFEAALTHLTRAGAIVTEIDIPALDAMQAVQARAGFSPVEASYIHRAYFEEKKHLMDPVVAARITRGLGVSAIEYIDMVRRRNALITEMDAVLAPYDALIMPTIPIVAPEIATVLESVEAFMPRTLMLIRNTFVANLFDLCSATLPMPSKGLPAGFMLTGRHMQDQRLFAVAASVERALAAAW